MRGRYKPKKVWLRRAKNRLAKIARTRQRRKRNGHKPAALKGGRVRGLGVDECVGPKGGYRRPS